MIRRHQDRRIAWHAQKKQFVVPLAEQPIRSARDLATSRAPKRQNCQTRAAAASKRTLENRRRENCRDRPVASAVIPTTSDWRESPKLPTHATTASKNEERNNGIGMTSRRRKH